jgi:serine protease
MMFPTRPIRLLRAAALAALALIAVLPAAHAAQPERVGGLIVQLRDAPTHSQLMRERAHGRAEAHASESARWQRVLAAMPGLRLSAREAALASAQRLRFAQPLTREQAQTLAERLAARPEVAWAVPDTRERRLANPPGDPYFDQQWWAQAVSGSDAVPLAQRQRGVPGFLSAWVNRDVTGSASARIAVLDSGILAGHPDLAGRVLTGYDMVSQASYANDGDGRDPDPRDPGDWVSSADIAGNPGDFQGCTVEDSKWHGTAIAGLVGAATNNGLGMAGINWAAPVLPVRVAGKCGASVGDIVDGMRWAAGLAVCRRSDPQDGSCLEAAAPNANPARVVNISFGGSGACDPYQQAIEELRVLGVVVVAAAGNEHATPTRPAKCPGVVGVVALHRDGFKSNYSNFGAALTASGIATVGGDDVDGSARWNALADAGLLSLGNSGLTAPQADGYYVYYGTSFSAPLVAGAVSLMLSVNPALTHAQIVQGLRASARPHVGSSVPGVNACSDANPGRCLCTTATCGAGILDAVQAVAYAANPGGYTAPVWPAVVLDSPELRAAAALGPDRPPNPPPNSGGSGGGGGAMSAAWLAALTAAVLALRRRTENRSH